MDRISREIRGDVLAFLQHLQHPVTEAGGFLGTLFGRS
jgi:hypothetical protein